MKQQNVSGVAAAIIIVGALIVFFLIFSRLQAPPEITVIAPPPAMEAKQEDYEGMYRGLSPLGIMVLLPQLPEDRGAGVRVSGVVANSPAARAGVQAGDRLFQFDNSRLMGVDPLVYVLYFAEPHKTYALHVDRSGKTLVLKATGITPLPPEERRL